MFDMVSIVVYLGTFFNVLFLPTLLFIQF